ncbi:MAG: GtrA family protein [Defluviitaleaceae bacterium]|nr:GtrA family protein [Defluviitaleaceae bacterium]
MKKLLVQFIKFGVVGVTNTIVFLTIYYVLLHFNVHYLAANLAAFALSVINAFFLSSKFVFKDSETPAPLRLAKVYAAYGFTFLLSTGTLFIMVDLLGISQFIAPLLNMFITVPTNFLVNKLWAFR